MGSNPSTQTMRTITVSDKDYDLLLGVILDNYQPDPPDREALAERVQVAVYDSVVAPGPVTADEIAGAIMAMFNTLLLLEGMSGYKSDDPQLADIPPFPDIPFQENIDEAVRRFDQPRIRQELVRRIYLVEEE